MDSTDPGQDPVTKFCEVGVNPARGLQRGNYSEKVQEYKLMKKEVSCLYC